MVDRYVSLGTFLSPHWVWFYQRKMKKLAMRGGESDVSHQPRLLGTIAVLQNCMSRKQEHQKKEQECSRNYREWLFGGSSHP